MIFLSIGELSNLEDNSVYPDLLRCFRDNGHMVHVVCQHERRSGLSTDLKIEHGIKVLRVETGNITKTNFIEKGISILLIGYQFREAIKKYFSDTKFDLILYSTPPITIESTVLYLKKRDKAFSYLMLKDIFPQNALDIGLLKTKGWKRIVTEYFFYKEKRLYLASDSIGCMSEANVEFLKKNYPYLKQSKIGVCPNTINPTTHEDFNKRLIKEKFKLPQDKVIFVYGGNFGKPQNVDFIIQILESNVNEINRHFVMCGSGTDFYKIKNYERNRNSTNLTVIDSLNKKDYDHLLNACDVGLIFLDRRFTIPNFPSRLLDYMNHSIPVLATTDKNTDVSRVILDGRFGWWCESKDVHQYNDIVNEICADVQIILEKGKLGRKYLEKYYDTKIAYDQIIQEYKKEKKGRTITDVQK